MKKIGLISLGCDKNRVDSEILLASARKKGYEIVSDPFLADVLVVNTCAFLESARQEAIEAIFDLVNVKNATGAKIVVCGCLPQKYGAQLFDELYEVDAIVGADAYSDFDTVLEKIENGQQRFCSVGVIKNEVQEGARILTTPSHYAYLRIADGCDNFCTYCAIPGIRGRFRSRRMESIFSEAIALVKGGTREIILVAQDVTMYGIDLYKEKSLASLIQMLSTIDDLKCIRLLYCYPEHIDAELIDEIAKNEKIVKYLDIPLQHVSDAILKKMNRKSTYKEITALLGELRERVDGIKFRSTFICGFPGESDEDVEKLNNFLKEQELTNVGFFEYSREEGTPAASFEGQIAQEEKHKRLQLLAATQSAVSEKANAQLVGKIFDVTIDEKSQEENIYIGRTYFMLPLVDGIVYVNSQTKLEAGQTIKVKITDFCDYDLIGETI